MSILAALAAIAALGFITGRLSMGPKIRELRNDISNLRDQVETFEVRLRVAHHIAGHDRLTGLPNRVSAATLFTAHQVAGCPTVVALVDLDHFKEINDSYGHHVGDDLLRIAAERLATAAKAHGGTAARLAGDEFCLILPANDDDPANPVVEIMDVLTEPATLHTDDGDTPVRIRASAGIAGCDDPYATFDTMLWHADIALYHAKERRGTYRTYHPEMRMPRNARRHGPRRRDGRPADHVEQPSGEATA